MLRQFQTNIKVVRSIHNTVINYLKRGTKPDYSKCREGFVPNFKEILEKHGGYTHEALPYVKTGGRDLETGRRICRRGGGHKRTFYLVDKIRIRYNEAPIYEKVLKIINNYPLHSSDLALVAGGTRKRWIIATEFMKVGDIIKSSGIIPRMPVRPIEGEAHPLGALPVGTLVNSVEMRPGWGGNWAMAAGTSCQIIRQASSATDSNASDPSDDGPQSLPTLSRNVLIRLPSKQEVSVDRECIGTVGRCSNIPHKDMVVGGPLQKLALGYRPRSGLWHRKDGTHGRKIRGPPPVRIYDKADLVSNFVRPNHSPDPRNSSGPGGSHSTQPTGATNKGKGTLRKPTETSGSFYRTKLNSYNSPISRSVMATIAPRKIDLDE